MKIDELRAKIQDAKDEKDNTYDFDPTIDIDELKDGKCAFYELKDGSIVSFGETMLTPMPVIGDKTYEKAGIRIFDGDADSKKEELVEMAVQLAPYILEDALREDARNAYVENEDEDTFTVDINGDTYTIDKYEADNEDDAVIAARDGYIEEKMRDFSNGDTYEAVQLYNAGELSIDRAVIYREGREGLNSDGGFIAVMPAHKVDFTLLENAAYEYDAWKANEILEIRRFVSPEKEENLTRGNEARFTYGYEAANFDSGKFSLKRPLGYFNTIDEAFEEKRKLNEKKSEKGR